MPSFHIQISTGPKGAAFEHAQYIAREGRFADEEKYGPVIAQGQANFPEWAREDRNAFWTASDEFERANGNTYREYELALPRELSREQQIALVERFAEQELGVKRVYQWAIHEPTASDGKPQPHVHLMFSDRQLDGIERGPERFFKRYNAKNPERGGAQKFSYGEDKAEAARTYEGIRERWAKVQNLALEHAGIEARVDHRSLAAQGIRDREPELHRGPAVSGIEARGEVSEVGRRQREQRLERSLERAAVVAEVRVVTREEMALEREAARERRELAQEVTGEDRAALLQRVEADRLEQIQRAQAAAERRVERRLGIGGRLLEQARHLRERIGEQLGRVKEWVREKFVEPFQQIQERARESIAETQAAARQRWLAMREQEREAGPPRTLEQVKAQGRADWLALRQAARDEAAAARERTRTPERSVEPAREAPAATSSPKPEADRSLDAAERARVLKEATALGRQELARQVQAVRDDQAARQRLETLMREEREAQRAQQLELERKQELERARKLEQEQAPKRGRGRGRGRGPSQDFGPER